MPPPFLPPYKTPKTLLPQSLLSPLKNLTSSSFSSSHHQQHQNPTSPIGSPARIQKLIASQPDPLLAKDIFDLASSQPNFCPSYSSYHSLILKLARSRHFSLADSLLRRLRSLNRPATPGLFTSLAAAYSDAGLPHKSIHIFHTMLQFDCNPLPRHLNRFLSILAAHRHLLPAALSLFRSAATRFGIPPDTQSYNILMRAFCLGDRLSVAYTLFNKMFKRDLMPDVESYRILMQGLCRKSQVNTALDLLDDMLNKGFVPDSLSYTTLLNSLCRKKKLREAYKLLCRMKVKGCNPDIIHYNTLIMGFCREGRAGDACKVLEEMPENGCLPNLVSYRTLVNGLCDQGMLDEAKGYMEQMVGRELSPHFSVFHKLVKGFCNVGKMDQACAVLSEMLRHGLAPHLDTWVMVVPRICDEDGMEVEDIVGKLGKDGLKSEMRLSEADFSLAGYRTRRILVNTWKA
ncbi:hypothetical protein MRB53_019518 [Persea americana]|uniref:Uncharacterized protein n=1 Tax=Persea americana TaxID=3435 RepID=A0ACC2KZ97_PERAE|nr:hypothetical protein MRB53_019518 [Persea americana]